MPITPILFALRGWPASGKSTFALEWVAEDPQWRFRVNRDDLRGMAHNSVYVQADPDDPESPGTERLIVMARNAIIVQLLQEGVSVVVDETNLPDAKIHHLMAVAWTAGAEFQMKGFVTPWEECEARNRARTGSARVPDDQMERMRAEVGDRDLRFLASTPSFTSS